MRLRVLQFLFIIFFVLLGLCLFYLQIVKGPLYAELSYRNSIRLLNITAPRGIIYDRQGRVLARNILSFGVFIVPQEAKDFDYEIRRLAKILNVSESLLKRNYKRNYRAPFAPCELMHNISKSAAMRIEEQKLDMPGVVVREIPLRVYPYKDATAHVVGYIGEMGREEFKLLKSYGYSVRDLIGKDGVEKVADSFLRGRNGGMQIQVDSRGRQVKVLNYRKPKRGKDVYLTIDAELQNFLWKMMKGRKGASVFMDPYTGEVLGLVSSPSFDPNRPLGEVLKDRESPFLNRAIMGQYPLGSLFKIVVGLAGLESGVINRETTFICHGRLDIGQDTFNCWNRDGHGPMQIERAIIESCNVFFYNLGLRLGMEKITEFARMFGLGRKTGIDLYGEMKGFVPTRSWKRAKKGESWYAGDTANLSIGQGYLLVTPIQIVRLVAAVANGGQLVEPYVLKKIGSIDTGKHKRIRLKLHKENLALIRRAMRGVVNDIEGTGVRAWSDIVSISAKTATSQVGPGVAPHGWFAGFAPSEHPEVAFVVFLEHGGSGGDFPALIARKAVEFWYKNQ